jgi:paired amphipathic helix protein Sin3a
MVHGDFDPNSGITPPSSITPSELEFFDQVKKLISNKTVYTEFLKVLNLFSQEILDKRTLMERIEGFLGKNTELLEWFQGFVKFDDSDEHIGNFDTMQSGLSMLI